MVLSCECHCIAAMDDVTHVGCRRVHAGTHPLNMNIGPSFASLHVRVFLNRMLLAYDVLITCRVLLVPAPWAFMILDLSTSAGEQTAACQSTAHTATKTNLWRRCPVVRSVFMRRSERAHRSHRRDEVQSRSVRHHLIPDQFLLEPVVAAPEPLSLRAAPKPYLASCDMFIKIARMPFGTTPRPHDLKPSSRVMRYKPCTELR